MRAFCWSKARRCRRALGNFFTLRDLVLKGHKPSSMRYLLASVPYRNQLNFTFDGLETGGRVGRTSAEFSAALELQAVSRRAPIRRCRPWLPKPSQRCSAALDDDLNTAQAQAAIFEMVRQANTALDSGALKKDDVDGRCSPR